MTGSVAPIVVTVSVPVPPAEAFAAFTDGMRDWWPEKHGFSGAPLAHIGFAPQVGALWAERAEDGTGMTWGRVLDIEAPNRVLLSWELTADWRTTDGPAGGSEIECVFTDRGQTTEVTLTHRALGRHADGAGRMREAMSSDAEGWPHLMRAFQRFLA